MFNIFLAYSFQLLASSFSTNLLQKYDNIFLKLHFFLLNFVLEFTFDSVSKKE